MPSLAPASPLPVARLIDWRGPGARRFRKLADAAADCPPWRNGYWTAARGDGMEVLISGVIVGAGIDALLDWLPLRVLLRLLGRRWAVFALDFGVFASLVGIHGGSAEGAIVASVGAACVHLALRWQRWWYSFVENHTYFPGVAHRNGWRRFTREVLR